STGSNWSPPTGGGAMGLGETVLAVGAGERPASFEQFSAAIDPAWIAAALAATGTASVRRRKLPAEHVVWLVIGMGLFHDRSIAQVVQHLDLVLPARNGGQGRVTNAAIVQARDQLGAKPLAALFAQTAAVWATTAADATPWRARYSRRRLLQLWAVPRAGRARLPASLVDPRQSGPHRARGPRRSAPRPRRSPGGPHGQPRDPPDAPHPARDAPRARRARPPPRLPPLPRLHLAPRSRRLSRGRARRALPRALGARTHLRRGQDAHPRAHGGPPQ